MKDYQCLIKCLKIYLLGLSIEYDDITFNEISIPIINENKYVYLEVLINCFLLDYNKKNVEELETQCLLKKLNV